MIVPAHISNRIQHNRVRDNKIKATKAIPGAVLATLLAGGDSIKKGIRDRAMLIRDNSRAIDVIQEVPTKGIKKQTTRIIVQLTAKSITRTQMVEMRGTEEMNFSKNFSENREKR